MEESMEMSALFQTANMLALLGWAALLASWVIPAAADRIAGTLVPLTLSLAYAGLVLAFWTRAEGGYRTLAEVMTLFTNQEIALAGWVHYLAFDLMIGAWEVRTARREGIAFPAVVPCLLLTFLFGPAGYLAFSMLRGARAVQRRSGSTA
jgi:hypothetical protein